MNFPSLGFRILFLPVLLFGLISCSPFSSTVKKETRGQPSFSQLIRNPQAYKGRTVMFGGTIAQTKNLKNTTLIEVIQKPLDSSTDRPLDTDRSGGRFLIASKKFLDPSIYSKDRAVTVVGKVLGVQPGVIGKRSYAYPVIGATQIHLWSESYYYPGYYYPGYFWGPGWGWGWGPGWGWGWGPGWGWGWW